MSRPHANIVVDFQEFARRTGEARARTDALLALKTADDWTAQIAEAVRRERQIHAEEEQAWLNRLFENIVRATPASTPVGP